VRLGVDFGTPNSSIAHYADGRLTQVRLDPLGHNPWVESSLLYVDRGYEGTQIIDRFYTVDELIALVLRPLKQRAEEQLREACAGV